MLDGFADERDIIDSTLNEAGGALGYDIAELINTDPAGRLNQTEYTQPAILAASIAIYRIFQARGRRCDFVAGHSLGEYTALVAAGALDFSEALVLVRTRGQLMQEAVQPGEGKMAAVIGADIKALENLCAEVSTSSLLVQVANYNSHKQVVISGHSAAVDAVLERLDETAAKRSVVLPVGVPSHCALMRPAAEKFTIHLDKVTMNKPSLPLLPNVDPRPVTDPGLIRDCLIRQLCASVQWVQTIENLVELSVQEFVECGPGRVLAGLQKQIMRP